MLPSKGARRPSAQTIDALFAPLPTIESRGRVMASTTFWLLGKGEQHSGKVEFSDEDAKGK
jgi:hypothetical protein